MYFDEWEVEHAIKGNERNRLDKETGEVRKKKVDKVVINHSAQLWLALKRCSFSVPCGYEEYLCSMKAG